MSNEPQIPIYRAKKIDSDEYVEGLVSEAMQIYSTNKDLKPLLRLWIWNKDGTYEIAPSTLAIHMKGMIDSEGTKIFASLSEDGGGGDICADIYDSSNTATMTMKDYIKMLENKDYIKVAGIQE